MQTANANNILNRINKSTTEQLILYNSLTIQQDAASEIPQMQLVLAAVIIFITAIVVAWACVKFYDVPVRKWLAKKFMDGNKRTAA